MPQVAWPTGAVVGNFDVQQFEPGLITLQPTYGGKAQIIHRGFAVWQATVTIRIPPIAPSDDDTVNRVVSALSELGSNPDNWTEMPLDLKTIDPPDPPPNAFTPSPNPPPVVESLDPTGTIATLSNNPGRLDPGRWFRSGNRAYLIESTAGVNITWTPNAPLPESSVIEPLTTIRVRLNNPAAMPHSFGRDGPYTVEVQEYPYD